MRFCRYDPKEKNCLPRGCIFTTVMTWWSYRTKRFCEQRRICRTFHRGCRRLLFFDRYQFWFPHYMIYRLTNCLNLVCLHQLSQMAGYLCRYSLHEKESTYSALDGNDTSRAEIKISRVQSQSVWYLTSRLLDPVRRAVGPLDQIPEIAG